jgi:hypothetical protein
MTRALTYFRRRRVLRLVKARAAFLTSLGAA